MDIMGQDEAAVAVWAERRLLIDGRLVQTERTSVSLNPATGEVLGHAPDAVIADAEAAVAAARGAFDGTDWSTNTELRIRCLEQLYRALTDHVEELRELTIAEVGSPRSLTHGAQLDEPLDLVRYYAEVLRTHPRTEDLGEVEYQGQRHHRWVEKEAAGVVAAIIPYNFPIQLALAKLAPALAAGCTVVLKGAPDTPLVTLALGELIAAHTDIPPGADRAALRPPAQTPYAGITAPVGPGGLSTAQLDLAFYDVFGNALGASGSVPGRRSGRRSR